MKRTTKPKNPDAILAADLHLRDDVPICRTDDFWEAQERKLDFILDLQERYDIPLLVAGDFFHRAKSSPFLEAWIIDRLDDLDPPREIVIVPGQHDLPNHNLDLLDRSSLAVLRNARVVHVGELEMWVSNCLEAEIWTFPYGRTPRPILVENTSSRRRICIAHYLIEGDFPGHESEMAKMFLMRMQGFDLVLTGDNHLQFEVEHQGRILINPGSMMRTAADQVDHRPAVYLWYAEDNLVERVELPFEEGVISRKHIEREEQRDERMEAFVGKLDQSYELSLSFRRNIESYFQKNPTRKAIRNKVWEAVEGGKGK